MKRNRPQQGFTLIETLVAIAILGIMMGAPFFAINQSIIASDASRDELIGSYLAQEGVEYVRSIRDGNYLYVRQNPSSTETWLYGLDGTDPNGNFNPSQYTDCYTPNLCTVDPMNNQVVSYTSTSSVPVLYLNNSTYLYSQSSAGGTPTQFTRTVQLIPITNNGMSNEVKILVTITWETRNRPYTTIVTEYLDDWLAV